MSANEIFSDSPHKLLVLALKNEKLLLIPLILMLLKKIKWSTGLEAMQGKKDSACGEPNTIDSNTIFKSIHFLAGCQWKEEHWSNVISTLMKWAAAF